MYNKCAKLMRMLMRKDMGFGWWWEETMGWDANHVTILNTTSCLSIRHGFQLKTLKVGTHRMHSACGSNVSKICRGIYTVFNPNLYISNEKGEENIARTHTHQEIALFQVRQLLGPRNQASWFLGLQQLPSWELCDFQWVWVLAFIP